MHFEFLIEDQSGEKMLALLIPKIINDNHTFRVHSYKGIGRIPKNLNPVTDPSKRILLDQLPKLLGGYGKSCQGYKDKVCVVVVCDLDERCLKAFRQELLSVLDACQSRPNVYFCIAIKEGEAWLLGDIDAIEAAYPKADIAKLKRYTDETQYGTWETLADALHKGGSEYLKKQGKGSVGKEKSIWAEKITKHLNIENNQSPSFCYFRDKIKALTLDE